MDMIVKGPSQIRANLLQYAYDLRAQSVKRYDIVFEDLSIIYLVTP